MTTRLQTLVVCALALVLLTVAAIVTVGLHVQSNQRAAGLAALDAAAALANEWPETLPGTHRGAGTPGAPEDLVSRLARVSSVEVAMVSGASGLEARNLTSSVAARLPADLAKRIITGGPEAVTVEIHEQPYLARAVRLPGGDHLLLLHGLGGAGRLTRSIGRDLALLGLAFLAFVLPVLWLTSRGLHTALGRLAHQMAQTAVTGRLAPDRELPSAASPDVHQLDQAFHQLTVSFEASQRDREQSYVEAVGAVVAAIDARDHETTGHSFRVAHYALALAREIGIHGAPLRAIEWGALLHDVGKIAVPDAILRKAGPLTDEEWFVMRQHPSWGFEMLADVKFLEPALEIVYSHHERWDGGGYPRGLEGEEIPLGARIFAVVDTYDSITSDRPYRRAKSHAEATAELCRVAGTQLDPEVVDAFMNLAESELRRLRELSEQLDLKVRIPGTVAVPNEERPRRSDMRAS